MVPAVISTIVFIFVATLFVPSQWFEANIVKKRLVDGPRIVNAETRFSVKRMTPLVMNLFTILNIRISTDKRKNIENQIQLANKESKWIVEDLITLKFFSGTVAFFYFMMLGMMSANALMLALALPGSFLGYRIPEFWLKVKIRKRQDQIKKELPYILNAIAIMSGAGMNLIPAMREVASKQNGQLAKEFNQVIHDVSVGFSQVKALDRMAERCQVEEMNRFISSLVQNIERGSSGITNVIRAQSKELWENRKKKAQQLGEKASMKLFFPLLLLAFPATLIFILGPALITIVEFFANY
ncbi:type II secretion system F family protein [Salibacterium salarium]|uniref:type II secretion system F family protein n=1 Tax=Salibacterium salarium TaxID=284579 RepID=UPI0027D7E219|nr:type II secretion system F family protein [Salibacterium salarium]